MRLKKMELKTIPRDSREAIIPKALPETNKMRTPIKDRDFITISVMRMLNSFTRVRLIKNIWANQNIGAQRVVRTDESMGVSQLLGASARVAPKVYAYHYACLFALFSIDLHK